MLGVGWGKGIFSVIRKLLGRGYAFMKTGVIIFNFGSFANLNHPNLEDKKSATKLL